MKQVMLCADDYGLNDAVSRGILALIEKQRLSATSCMVNFNHWPNYVAQIKPYAQKAAVGLHLNLTEGKPLTACHSLVTEQGQFLPLFSLIKKSHLRQIHANEVTQEIQAQLNRFQETVGQLPAFIDGHQHIHHLPIIREALLSIYNEQLKNSGTMLRNVYQPLWPVSNSTWFKIQVVQYTGARYFSKLLKRNHIPNNQVFAGFYNFHPQANYRKLFNQFLIKMPARGGLIMCHPGYQDKQDSIAAARENELNYFLSNDFLTDCQTQKIQLTTKL
jgi:predicted glycoside hydrolase/deacetylase ChbG (UPF0249 family)